MIERMVNLEDVQQAEPARTHGGVDLGALPVLSSQGGDYRELARIAEEQDRAAVEQLRRRLDPKVLKAVQVTARALEEAEKALAGAQARLEAHDARPTDDLANVTRRAAERGTIVGEVQQLIPMVAARRQSHEQATDALQRASRPIFEQIWGLANQQITHDEAEYRRMKEEARQFMTRARERHEAMRRLYQKVSSGDVDLFR